MNPQSGFTVTCVPIARPDQAKSVRNEVAGLSPFPSPHNLFATTIEFFVAPLTELYLSGPKTGHGIRNFGAAIVIHLSPPASKRFHPLRAKRDKFRLRILYRVVRYLAAAHRFPAHFADHMRGHLRMGQRPSSISGPISCPSLVIENDFNRT